MSKIINVVYGVGIAIILFTLVILGIQAFYPEPESGWEACEEYPQVARPMEDVKINLTEEDRQKIQECYDVQEELRKDHEYTSFLIASVLAGIFLILAYFVLSYPHIAAGIASAGVVLVFYAFVRGWNASGPKARFLVGLVLAIIVILFAYLTANKMKKK